MYNFSYECLIFELITEEATKFVKIFNEIERLSQLLKYYEKCQKGSLCQYWKSLIDSDQDLNMAEQLRSLYDMLLVNWQKQVCFFHCLLAKFWISIPFLKDKIIGRL